VQETLLVQFAQWAMQAVQVSPERKYPLAQVVHFEYAVQVAQTSGQAEQVWEAETKKYPFWQLRQAVGPLQLAQGSEQAMQLGELR
jgi:hypothetical protein